MSLSKLALVALLSVASVSSFVGCKTEEGTTPAPAATEGGSGEAAPAADAAPAAEGEAK